MNLQTCTFGSSNGDTTGTSSGGMCERVPRLPVIVVSGALFVSGTSSAAQTRLWDTPYVHEADATASTLGWEIQDVDVESSASEPTRSAISELRRISGLTWEQLGQLFEVSRRSVHFWASGNPLNASNEERLLRVLDVVREGNRGDARSTRAALLEVTDGATPFDLLVSQRFDEARAVLGRGGAPPAPQLAELSAEAQRARMPLAPEELVDAKHDRVHRDPGRARAARAVRNKRRGST